MQESTEIIQSLENLNTEIREIWETIKKNQTGNQQSNGSSSTSVFPSFAPVAPPPPSSIPFAPQLFYGDVGWTNFPLTPPYPYRNTVITSTSNFQR